LVNVVCYICGSNDSRLWATENGFQARRCAECGLVYVSPRPAAELISKAAESGLHGGETTLDIIGRYGGAKKVRFYGRRLAELYPNGHLRGQRSRWLDVGCGYGEFLEALARASAGTLRLIGSEPNQVKAASARARGLDVTFRDLDSEHERYGYASLLNVYSHLPDPPSFLSRLRELLSPAGELVLQTGNWAELERDQIPDRLCLPDHLSFASEKLIARVLERAGFEVLAARRYRMFRPTLRVRLRNWLTEVQAEPSDLWFRARAS
jgi:2-polyprenyl-3-methyl-5-hydroxy-6-metoxy-1,4-benzoquinol methylase